MNEKKCMWCVKYQVENCDCLNEQKLEEIQADPKFYTNKINYLLKIGEY